MDHSTAVTNLRDIINTLTQFDMHPVLIAGTLLGAIRENDFISHDNDIDIGIRVSEWDPKVVDAIKAAGFHLKYIFGQTDCGLEHAFTRDGIKIDVFCIYEEDKVSWAPLWVPPAKGYARYLRNLVKITWPKFELSPYSFLGISCYVPADTESVLVAHYGKDWRIPVTKWNWMTGAHNRFPTNTHLPFQNFPE